MTGLLWPSTMASKDPYPSPPPSPAQIKTDPILRNALRYTLSAKEYKTFHQYLISRSPTAVRTRALAPPKYAALVQTKDDYNGAAIRASLRAFIATQTSLKLWELIKGSLLNRGKPQRYVNPLLVRSIADLWLQSEIENPHPQIHQPQTFPFTLTPATPPPPPLPLFLPSPLESSDQRCRSFSTA